MIKKLDNKSLKNKKLYSLNTTAVTVWILANNIPIVKYKSRQLRI